MNDQPIKILVAEDEEINFRFLEIVLKHLGVNLNLIRAYNGLEAVELFKKNEDVSLILMDIRMPIMTGIEATAEIRKFNTDVPIIAQTALVQDEDRQMAKTAGITEFITKPIMKNDFNLLLEKYLKP